MAMMTTLKHPESTTRVEPSNVDLSEAIEHCIDRWPGEQVKCTRVYGDRYRCNWMRGAEIGIAGRILKSRFLKVTWNQGKLEIEDVTG